MQHPVTALCIAVAFAALGGCGQTGPLYMPPPEEAAQHSPSVTPAEPVEQPAAGS